MNFVVDQFFRIQITSANRKFTVFLTRLKLSLVTDITVFFVLNVVGVFHKRSASVW